MELMIVTVSLEIPQKADVTVQANTEVPLGNPLIPVEKAFGLLKVPAPLTTVHKPVPLLCGVAETTAVFCPQTASELFSISAIAGSPTTRMLSRANGIPV